jgi:hypothetical protein
MSRTLFQSTNILVKWVLLEKEIKYAELDFTILVNWKLSTFREIYAIDDDYNLHPWEKTRFLDLVHILSSIWYHLSESKYIEEDTTIWENILIEWTEKLKNINSI